MSKDILRPLHWPEDSFAFLRFGILTPWPASMLARILFKTERTRALFAGIAAHSVLPLSRWGSSAIAWPLVIAAHAVGWPIARGGSQKIADALASYFRSLGGEIVTGQNVRSLRELRDGDALLCDISPRQLLALAGDELPPLYRRALERYRYGPGVFKMDWALSGPVPWRAEACARAGTVHLGGTLEEILESERAPFEGRLAERPFVLAAQPSLFDPTRAPAGRHTLWAYAHVPNGWRDDASKAIEDQIERFAPGFRTRILARSILTPADLERRNANLIGGDITGGRNDWRQLFVRPTLRYYRTPRKGLYLCSASTPPGGGVHGMCGYHAAHAALEDLGT